MMKEIDGFEGRYFITDDGKVFSHLSNKYLRPKPHSAAAHDADVLQQAMAVIAKGTVRKGVFES